MSRLWAITTYFNPAGYRRRHTNYTAFFKRLALPLATVELSFDGHFALGDTDADFLLRLRGTDVMWQKERLLNCLLPHLPSSCDRVAWIDCDVIFESNQWITETQQALDHATLAHLCSHRINLPKHASCNSGWMAKDRPYSDLETPSALFLHARGEATDDDFRRAGIPVGRRSTVGLAWASHRILLERHGFYDACIVGAADRAILGAALGRFDYGIEALHMTAAAKNHYLSWARGFYNDVRGHVTHIPGRLFHLWHGDLSDRHYEDRLDILTDASFDPSLDITLNENGLWRWSTAKPELHQQVKAYFFSRKEDG